MHVIDNTKVHIEFHLVFIIKNVILNIFLKEITKYKTTTTTRKINANTNYFKHIEKHFHAF